MPIYEYSCKACEERFEELVKANGSGVAVDCPECGSSDTQRLLSVFAVRSGVASSPQTVAAAPRTGGCCGGACGCH